MLVFALAYLGGVLTILSPCILPVLPFVFARADRPFVSSGLPLLLGMAVTFAGVATLAAVGGGWAVEANQWGRWIAIAILGLFGLVLLFPRLSDRLMQPVVALGSRLSDQANEGAGRRGAFGTSFLLGIATGLLWAPCAGPILGLVLTGAALEGASVGTTVLLLAYALGAATSLAVALLVGGRVFAAMKRSLGAGEWVRRGLGAAVILAVVAIAFGLDTGYLTRLSTASTAKLEQSLIDSLGAPAPEEPSVVMKGDEGGGMMMMGGGEQMTGGPAMMAGPSTGSVVSEGAFPSLAGATEWLNSAPLSPETLKGKVVLIDFWTYSCINCLRAIPYVRAWAEKYEDQGLVVIGVHSPEFAFEKDIDNVKDAMAELQIGYPVAIDNEYGIWRAFRNQYWPAHYFIDAEGRIRGHHFGEGNYDESERLIQELLKEAGTLKDGEGIVQVAATGAEAAADMDNVKSPETYIGYDRAEDFVSPGGALPDKAKDYEPAANLGLNDWDLAGNWTVEAEHANLGAAGGKLRFRFHARDLHLVLGPGADGKPVRFRVLIDGQAPDAAKGIDVDAAGNGTVTEHRLYQLIRQPGAITDHVFEIEFLDPGVQAYAFTFG